MAATIAAVGDDEARGRITGREAVALLVCLVLVLTGALALVAASASAVSALG